MPLLHKYVALCMANGHVMRAFFKTIPSNWLIWADGWKKIVGHLGYFKSNSQDTFCYRVSPVHDFQRINNHFYKNLSLYKYFKGIFI